MSDETIWQPGDEQYSDRNVELSEESFRLSSLIRVAYHQADLRLSDSVAKRVRDGRTHFEAALAAGTPIYGSNTGVGALSELSIAPEDSIRLSRNIVVSHACGVGDPLPAQLVRAIMVAQVCNFGRGHSGVRLELVERILALLNSELTPYVPSRGSVGSLTHMAHVGLTLLGLGQAYWKNEVVPASEGLRLAGLEPIVLEAGEGLAMVSGTSSIVGIGAVAIHDAYYLARWADLAGSMSLEALRGNPAALDPRVHAARPHQGQSRVAANILKLVAGSELLYGEHSRNLQDGLSLRTIPQVHGACRDVIGRAADIVTTELNSATSNPLVFESDGQVDVVSACNSHGEPMAQCLDAMTAAVAELGNISERRTDRTLNAHVSRLPAFLAPPGGLHCGLMIVQYVSAYLVAENKVLAHPVSVDSIPMSAFQEDHVVMGTLAAINAHRVVRNAQRVIAAELLAAAQGLEIHKPRKAGAGVAATLEAIRTFIEPLEEDRILSEDLERLYEFVRRGAWLDQLQEIVGEL